MRRATIIVGAGFGGEGKGLIADYATLHRAPHVCGPAPLVVRFNGGANASQTVTLADGRSHEFHSYGPGAFLGAPTYLSSHFILNPIEFVKETTALYQLGIAQTVFINKDALLTLPADMLINQASEVSRGKRRLGSTGLGINETVTRNEDWRYRTSAKMLDKPATLTRLINLVNSQWLPRRLQKLGFQGVPPEMAAALHGFTDQFMKAASNAAGTLLPVDDGVMEPYDHIVFVGAQGLELDEQHALYFPHVTRSRTGIVNALRMARSAAVDEIEVIYVTRPYCMRHGAGPLPFEGIDWRLNVTLPPEHPFMGHQRYAPLDLDRMLRTIIGDMDAAALETGGNPNIISTKIAVTHLDEVAGRDISWRVGNQWQTGDAKRMLWELYARAGAGFQYLYAYGPTRDHVQEVQL